MATKRWTYNIRMLIEETDTLLGEIDGKLLSQKLSSLDRSALTNLKTDLKRKLKLKKAAFKIETVETFKLRVQSLEKLIDLFPNEEVTKEKYVKIVKKEE